MRKLLNSSLGLFGALLLITLPTITYGQSNAIAKEISWDTRPDNLNLDGKINKVAKFICPPNGRVIGVVDGTDTYSSESSICNAAVHAGLITIRGGGEIVIKILPNIGTYVGTTRHDISSRSGGFGVANSFIFLQPNGSPVTDLGLQEIGWDTRPDMLDLAGRLDQDFKFICPPNGRVIGVVDGTDTYSSESSICGAAVHAGLINIRDGGKVAIRIRPNIGRYVGTTRHDISSRSGDFSVANSFIFLQPDGSPVAHKPTPSADSTASPFVIPHPSVRVCLPFAGCVVK